MINNTKIEICIGNVTDALKAAEYPIDRIELNSALELGGLSPAKETLCYLKKKIAVPICCMVRPRGGDFFYDEIEFKLMLKQAKSFLKNGADGIVFGFLREDHTVDTERTKKMVKLIHSYKKEAIFHKAFDAVPDQFEAIDQLYELGIDRILTGDGESSQSIVKGSKKIHELYEHLDEKIQLLPGGGVRIENAAQVLKTARTGQIHMTSKKTNPGGYIELDTEQLEAILKKIEKARL